MQFPQRVTIQRKATTKAADGEVTETFSTLTANVPCVLQPRSGSYRHGEAGRETRSDFFAAFAVTTDVVVGDRVVHAFGTFEVTFRGNYEGHHIEVDLARVVA